MRKTRLFLFLAILLCSSKVFAYDFLVDNIAYNITSATSPYTVAVTSGGTYTDAVTIPATVENEGTTYDVTAIGASAFLGCSGMNSIIIPSSVVSIGNSAFQSCSNLTGITIPDGVKSIGEGAFYACSKLTSITIPSSVTSIRKQVFFNCSGLTSITIPNSVTSIEDQAFLSCRALTSITIPNSVTSIGVSAFNSSGLTSITIPNSVTSIGASAFLSSALISITIPNSVTSMGNSAFQNCTKLATVTSLIEKASNVNLGTSVFTKQSGKVATLYIPFGTSSAYGTDWTAQFTTTSEVPAVITVTDALYATYCSTGNIDFTDSGLEAYLASSYDATTGKLTVTKCNKIPAGEGMR